MNQKGFVNIILIIVVIVLSGVVGYFVLVRKVKSSYQQMLSSQTPTHAPIETCAAKKNAINLALEAANYCETDSDCKFFQPDGFSCWRYINKSFDASTILQRIGDYGRSCAFTTYKCPTVRPARCIQKKCSADYR